MINAIQVLGKESVVQLVEQFSTKYGIPKNLHIDFVCNACCDNPDLAPNINANRKKNLLSHKECVEQWVIKFLHGYEERISEKKSNYPTTIPDQAVSTILAAGLHCHTLTHIHRIVYAHRLGMSAENILGLLLEEFLFSVLSTNDWALAWGESIRSVDFCNKDGYLLQIKNRSNSENSSSNKIRNGKPIAKWYRINATTGQCEWNKLLDIVGYQFQDQLNEQKFQEFIKQVLDKNPEALAIEANNPWQEIINKQN